MQAVENSIEYIYILNAEGNIMGRSEDTFGFDFIQPILSCRCEENCGRFLGYIISQIAPTPSMSLLYSTIVLYD